MAMLLMPVDGDMMHYGVITAEARASALCCLMPLLRDVATSWRYDIVDITILRERCCVDDAICYC